VFGEWLTGLGVVDGHVPTSGLDGEPPGLRIGPHDAVNLHGRGPQSHALLLAGRPRSLLAFAPPEGSGVRDEVEAAAPGLPAWRSDEHEVLRWCRLVAWAGGPCNPADLRLLRVSRGLCGDECGESSAITPSGPHSPAHTEAHGGPYVVLHPGAASGSRRWPVDRWAVVARVVSRRADVRLTGSMGERALCEHLASAAGLPVDSVVAGSLDLPGLLDLVAHAGLLVCGDTGVAHVATATGTPSVLLFGPVSPTCWGPVIDHELHHVIWHGDGSGDPHADVPDPALLRITPDEVLAAADALLDR
jgi:ADP-heptose:LPS heptosyltransferase